MRNTTQSKILSFYKKHHRMPSYREVMQICGYKTKSAAHYAVKELLKEGVLNKDKQGRLIPHQIGSLPLLGLVEAGFPSPAEEELTDTMSLDDYLIDNREATYILQVKGDSMVDAGICAGDMVIVERTNNPRVGDIVIAEVDGQWTMKYLRKGSHGFYLEPANKRYKPIYPESDLKISAVVKGVVRKY